MSDEIKRLLSMTSAPQDAEKKAEAIKAALNTKNPVTLSEVEGRPASSGSQNPETHNLGQSTLRQAQGDSVGAQGDTASEEIIGTPAQGTRPSARQTTRPQRWKGNQIVTQKTNSPTRRYALMGGLAVFVATVTFGTVVTLRGSDEMTQLAALEHSQNSMLSVANAEVVGVAEPAAAVGSAVSAAGSVVSAAADMAASAASSIVSGAVAMAAPAASSLSFSPAAPATRALVLEGEVEIGRLSEPQAANPVTDTRTTPVSTFSIDVDTASYSLVRQALEDGYWPRGQIRVEEMVNYFDYAYPQPTGDVPFETTMTLTPSPWNAQNQLLHIAVQGMEIEQEARPAANLVFLIDTSGSMNSPDKLGLLKRSFSLLLDQLDARDSVAIVTYAGSAGVALAPTEASETDTILSALNNLTAGGSTAGAAGIEGAYALAEQMQAEGSVSRVILATDGDFNVGVSSQQGLETLIEEKREQGTFLSVLTFGRSHGGDRRAQTLAQNGNGIAANIDSLAEARKVLVEGALGQLVTIAKDVKIQVEFNPANVASYRLIGYETRALNREDFDNDTVDAGEIGAGHQVTAIYELTPTQTGVLDGGGDLRYEQPVPADEYGDEVAFLKMRYKDPEGDESKLLEWAITADAVTELSGEPAFAAAVAAFGQYLADSPHLGGYGLEAISDLAFDNLGADEDGYRTEFVDLVRKSGTVQSLRSNDDSSVF